MVITLVLIIQMDKEIRELTKQRDLAESRIEDLLRTVGKEQISKEVIYIFLYASKFCLLVFVLPSIILIIILIWQEEEIWEDDSSVSESSSICGPNTRIREFNNPHYNGGDSGSYRDGKSFHFRACIVNKLIKSMVNSYVGKIMSVVIHFLALACICTEEDLDEYCKEVRCVELEESSRDNSEYLDPSVNDNGDSDLTVSEGENVSDHGISTRLNEDNRDEHVMSGNMSNHRNLNLTRSWSCSRYRMTGSPETGEMERTPANGFEKGLPGRPDGLWRKFNPLNYDGSKSFSRHDSQSSIESQSVDDEHRGNSMGISGDEDITSIHTFVAGMKEMVKLEYEKQFVDGQVRINNFRVINLLIFCHV